MNHTRILAIPHRQQHPSTVRCRENKKRLSDLSRRARSDVDDVGSRITAETMTAETKQARRELPAKDQRLRDWR
jgi:hypothetical protein